MHFHGHRQENRRQSAAQTIHFDAQQGDEPIKLDLDTLLASIPQDEDELKAVQAKHRQILSDNREKEKQRKARTHRLCEHGAILEAYFPQTVEMDNAQFSAFLQELADSR